MVTPLPRRRPWQVVRQIVTLDHLSGGRAVLGVGIGYPPKEEYEVFGESGDQRVRAELLDEGLDVVTGLMSGRPFSYDGRHFHLDDVEFAPQPVQRPRVPIWVAGTWPYRKPFRRAARYDGVVPIARDANEDEILVDVPAMREIVAYTDEHRTDDGPFDRVFTGYLPEDTAEARAITDELTSFGVNWWQVGPGPGEPLDAVREWIRLGPPT